MEVFQDYAYYYNLFYGDKDYKGEAAVVDKLLKRYKKNKIHTVLNMGCGTGRHDALLEQLGYSVSGIDFSGQMIEIARKSNPTLNYEVADIRNYKSKEQFDAVISLFHVMSYQNENEDIEAALRTAHNALSGKGILLFDVWFGPGVMTDRPTVRVKKVEDSENILIRYANPVMHATRNIVDVNYEILVINKQTQQVKKMEETHHMRYYFQPELQYILEKNGFQLLECIDCNTLAAPDYQSWTAYFAAVKA